MIAHIESEKAVLGAMLRSGTATSAAVDRLRPEDFSNAANREIFNAMLSIALANGQPDLVTLDAELSRRGKLEAVGGSDYLIEIRQAVPSAVNVDVYINTVLEKANLRRLQAVAESIKRRAAAEDMSADSIIELIENACNDIATRALQRDAGWISGGEIATMAYEAAAKREKTIPTGFAELDDILCGGLVRPELTIVGARPGKGKSAFLLTAAMNAAKEGCQVGYFSLEMSALQLGQRALAATTLVSVNRQRTNALGEKDWERLSNGLTALDDSGIAKNLHIYQSYGLTLERLGNVAKHAVKRGEMDLLVLDYLQLLRTTEKTNSDWERLGIVSKGLKQLALGLNIPILTAAQVRRQSQDDSKKGGRAPTLDELRGSGDLEQDADNVLLIHIPDNPEDATIKHISPLHQGIYERAKNASGVPFTVEVAKQRQGATGRTWFIFKPTNMRFYDDTTH